MHKIISVAYTRKLIIKWFVATWLMLVASSAFCLSLGDATLKSYLNQPLRVHIPITQARSEDWDEQDILLSLEPSEVYTQRGINYPWSVGQIDLSLKKNSRGDFYIEGRSQKVVQELLVPLIVNLEWPKGRLKKEYTLLVDVDGVTNIQASTSDTQSVKTPEIAEPQPLQLTVQSQDGKPAQTIAIPPSESNESIEQSDIPKELEAIETVELLEDKVYSEIEAEREVAKDEESSSQDNSQAAKPAIEQPIKIRHKANAGFPNNEPIYQHRVKRGDILSLLAQRYRGDVELPLHRYIHAINDANVEKHPQGLEKLEVGQLIRIPNPKQVAGTYAQTKRRLDNPNATTPYRQYTVKYGDSLFLIARAFKPSGIEEQQFMAVLTEENPQVLGGNRSRLQPGAVLNIPNTQSAAVELTAKASIEPELKQSTDVEQPVPAQESIKSPIAKGMKSPVAVEPTDANNVNDNAVINNQSTASSKPLGPVLDNIYSERQDSIPVEVDISTLPAAPVLRDERRINPRLRANLRAIEQYVVTDEANQVYDVIQTQTRLPLLYEQILRTNEQLGELKLAMSALRAENQQLRDELAIAKQERASSRRVQYILLALLALLLFAGIVAYWLMRRWVQKNMHLQTPFTMDDSQQEKIDTPSKNIAQGNDADPTDEGLKGKFKDLWKRQFNDQKQRETGDYSNYDFSKSNYDYSKNYDVEHLESALKSGENPFAKEEPVVEVNALRSNVSTVNELIENGEFEAANALLDSLLTIDSSSFELWHARLKMKLAMGQKDEAEALQKQLLQMFDDPAQNETLRQIFSEGNQPAEQTYSTQSSASYPEPNADKLYEVRVYLSYGHFDMAKQALDAILAENPEHVETLLLQLELFGLSGQINNFEMLAHTLNERIGQMSESEKTTFEKLQKSQASTEKEQADISSEPEVISAESEESSENWELVDDEEPLSLDLDEIEELEDQPVDLIEARTDEEKEFMAAIQEQMESYTMEDAASSAEEDIIPDDLRIPD